MSDLLPAIVPFRPLLDRRSVSRRWLAAIVLVAGGGSALLGVAAVRLGPPRATRAELVRLRGRATFGAMKKEDRLARMPREARRPTGHVKIEQLAAPTDGIRAHTYVLLDLGPRADPTPPTAAVLPPQILYGTARPPAPIRALAYADPLAEPPPLGEPLNLTKVERDPPEPPYQNRVISARPADDLATILHAAGLTAQAATEAAAVLSGQRWFSSGALSGDERVSLDIGRGDAVGHPRRVSLMRPASLVRIAALADDGHYRLLTAANPDHDASDSPVAIVSGEGSEDSQSLRAALAGAGRSGDLDPGLVDEIARVSAHDLDLSAPVSALDRAEVVFDEEDGRPRLAFLALNIGGHSHRYYRFEATDDGSIDYYDAQGRSVTSFLLRKPVAAGRLGDGFGWRIHPVLGDRRFHQGVDYAAPFNSPIVAAGAGTIERIGQEWGYGKFVRVRHDLGYETTYAHISAVPRSLAVGQRVHQGQVIAFVGSTGISTGPHLYYEVRINGHNVDPLTVRLAGGRVLDGSTLLAFATARDRTDSLLHAAELTIAGR